MTKINILNEIIEKKKNEQSKLKELLPNIELAVMNITRESGKASDEVEISKLKDVKLANLKDQFAGFVQDVFNKHTESYVYPSWVNAKVTKKGDKYIFSIDLSSYVYGLKYPDKKYLKYVKEAIRQYDENFYKSSSSDEVLIGLKIKDPKFNKYTLEFALRDCGFEPKFVVGNSVDDGVLMFNIAKPKF